MATRLEPFARKQPGAARQADHVEHRAQHTRHKGNHMHIRRKRRRPQNRPEEDIRRRGHPRQDHDIPIRLSVRPLKTGKLHRQTGFDRDIFRRRHAFRASGRDLQQEARLPGGEAHACDRRQHRYVLLQLQGLPDGGYRCGGRRHILQGF